MEMPLRHRSTYVVLLERGRGRLQETGRAFKLSSAWECYHFISI